MSPPSDDGASCLACAAGMASGAPLRSKCERHSSKDRRPRTGNCQRTGGGSLEAEESVVEARPIDSRILWTAAADHVNGLCLDDDDDDDDDDEPEPHIPGSQPAGSESVQKATSISKSPLPDHGAVAFRDYSPQRAQLVGSESVQASGFSMESPLLDYESPVAGHQSLLPPQPSGFELVQRAASTLSSLPDYESPVPERPFPQTSQPVGSESVRKASSTLLSLPDYETPVVQHQPRPQPQPVGPESVQKAVSLIESPQPDYETPALGPRQPPQQAQAVTSDSVQKGSPAPSSLPEYEYESPALRFQPPQQGPLYIEPGHYVPLHPLPPRPNPMLPAVHMSAPGSINGAAFPPVMAGPFPNSFYLGVVEFAPPPATAAAWPPGYNYHPAINGQQQEPPLRGRGGRRGAGRAGRRQRRRQRQRRAPA